MNNNLDENEYDDETITLHLDDGDLTCSIVASFPVGDKDYIALLPDEPYEGYEEGEVFLYGYKKISDDEIELIDIVTEEEYAIAADAFDELLDNEMFNNTEE